MSDEITIRPLHPKDRTAVRQICCDTADAGAPLENFFTDRELVADLVTRYYTDYCRDYSWVVELDGRIAGYLTAAPDTAAFKRTLQWRIVPGAFLRALFRGTFFTRSSAAMVRALILRKGQAIRPPFKPPSGYPAHLHIDLATYARNKGVGRILIDALISKLKTGGIPGVHVTVRTDNTSACAFFERMDFVILSHYSEILPAKEGVKDVQVTVYGRSIS